MGWGWSNLFYGQVWKTKYFFLVQIVVEWVGDRVGGLLVKLVMVLMVGAGVGGVLVRGGVGDVK